MKFRRKGFELGLHGPVINLNFPGNTAKKNLVILWKDKWKSPQKAAQLFSVGPVILLYFLKG